LPHFEKTLTCDFFVFKLVLTLKKPYHQLR